MPLGVEVGFGPGDIVLDEDPALPTERDTVAHYLRTKLHIDPSNRLATIYQCYRVQTDIQDR